MPSNICSIGEGGEDEEESIHEYGANCARIDMNAGDLIVQIRTNIGASCCASDDVAVASEVDVRAELDCGIDSGQPGHNNSKEGEEGVGEFHSMKRGR